MHFVEYDFQVCKVQFLQHLERMGYSDETFKGYGKDLDFFLSFLSNRFQTEIIGIDMISKDDLLAFMDFGKELGHKPNTIARRLSTIKSFYKFLVNELDYAVDVAARIKLPKVYVPIVDILSETEMEQLLTYTKRKSSFYHLMFSTLYYTGSRLTPVRTLEKKNVHLEERMLYFPKVKGGKDLYLPLHHKLVELYTIYLKEHYFDESPYVFPSKRIKSQPVSASDVRMKLSRMIREAGISKAIGIMSTLQRIFSLEQQIVLEAYENENNRYRKAQYEKLELANVELVKKNQEFETIFNSVNALFFSYDILDDTVNLSKQLSKFLHLPEADKISPAFIHTFIHPEEKESFSEWMWTIKTTLNPGEGQFRMVLPDGSIRWLIFRASPVVNQHGEIFKVNGMLMDETDRIELEKRIHHFAYYDALTDLPNRYSLLTRLETLFFDQTRKHAVLFVDFDDFKSINDYYGHHAGDIFLKEIAGRLLAQAPKEENIFRLGGDEFIFILEDVDSTEAVQFARSILASFKKPISWSETSSFMTASIGIALFPDHGNDMNRIITNADTAMYAAKESGKNQVFVFSYDLSEEMTKKMRIQNDLKKAIELGEFSLVFQPKVSLATGAITSMEALLRWYHPELGVIPPNEFIPIAEKSGVINWIGEWVLEESLRHLKRCEELGFPDLMISINVSPNQLVDPYFIEKVQRKLLKYSVAPSKVELEITENVLKDGEEVVEVLNRVKKLGVKLAVDDFGRGYSSLYLLVHFPVDFLKIDRSFIENINTDVNQTYLMKTVIDVGNRLNLKVVAEGVETAEQVAFLVENHCDYVQGYYYSPPLPFDQLIHLLKTKPVFSIVQ